MDDGRRRPVGRGMAAMLIAGQCTRHRVWRSRRDGGRGRPCSRRGHGPCGDAPPIFFSVLAEKKTGRARSKRKGRFGALRCSGPPRDGGRRIGASVDLGWPSGTLGSSARSILPSRGGWCPGRRVARTHLTSFSFTVSRCGAPSISVTSVPLVPPSARSASLRAPLAVVETVALTHAATFIDHSPAAAKREAGCIPNFPGPKDSPRTARFRP